IFLFYSFPHPPPPTSPPFPYTTLFRSKPFSSSFGACSSAPSYLSEPVLAAGRAQSLTDTRSRTVLTPSAVSLGMARSTSTPCGRSEEHTSELQSRGHLVCRLLLEKKNA